MNLQNISIIIEHDETRIDDHLQYIVYEDPSIINTLNIRKGEKINYKDNIKIYSNGLSYKFLK